MRKLRQATAKDVLSRPGPEIFYKFMLNTSTPAACSRKALERSAKIIARLISQAADFNKTFLYLEQAVIHNDRFPFSRQRMTELKDMMAVFQRQLMLEHTELMFRASQSDTAAEVDAFITEQTRRAQA